MSKPTGSVAAFLRLSVSSALVKITTIETPTWTTSRPRRNPDRRGALPMLAESDNGPRPGLAPAMRPSEVSRPVAPATRAMTRNTRTSTCGVALRYEPSCEKCRTSSGRAACAISRPAPVPARNSRPTSVASWRARRNAPAPRAERTRSSRRRRTARLTSRPTTLLHATSSARPAPSTAAGRVLSSRSPQRPFRGPMLTPAARLVSGCVLSRSSAMTSISVRAASRSMPRAKRPTAQRLRAPRLLRDALSRSCSSESHASGRYSAGKGGKAKRSGRTPTIVWVRSLRRRLEPTM